MNRYLLWSLILHIAVVLGGAAVAPLKGLTDGRQSMPVVISVGLVELPSQPATKAMLAPHLRAPAPAKDAEVALAPAPSLTKEDVKEKEKPKPKETGEKEKEKSDKPDSKKPDTLASALAQSDTASGTTGSISQGGGASDEVWGVEVGASVNPYHRRGFAAIRTNWRNPAVGPTGRKCIVRFRVKRSGELTDVALESSSGSQLFDRSALRAVEMTHAWEQFPKFWDENEQIIRLEFEYRP